MTVHLRPLQSLAIVGLVAVITAVNVSTALPQTPTVTLDRGSAELMERLASRPAPTLEGGVPDLNGTWDHLGPIEWVRPQVLQDGSVLCITGCSEDRSQPIGQESPATYVRSFPEYRPEFRAKVAELSENQVELDTSLRCAPPGVPRIGPPRKIVQTFREVVFFYEDITGGHYRVVPIDGRGHRERLPASYLGDAVGHFEGDTLIVETLNFNDETWLIDNGAFHTKDLQVVERLRRVGDTIEYEAVAHDPAVLVEPWVERVQTLWLTDMELEEPVRCIDRDLDLLIDGSHHDNLR